MLKKTIAKIALIISVVLLVISITVFGSSFGRNVYGCLASFVMMPISCVFTCVSAIVFNYMRKRFPGSLRPSLPPTDTSAKRLSDVAKERKEGIIFCPSCGEKNLTDSIHCSNCGFQL